MGYYEYVIDKTHPRSNTDGQVYLHIVVAEDNLGRSLLPDEVVHHKDLNKLNNNPENLMVFATRRDHTRFHMNGCNEDMLSLNSNGAYSCVSFPKSCVDCGDQISRGAVRCKECAYKHTRKAKRPHPTVLADLLFSTKGNFTEVGKLYGVTDNAIRKWCDAYNLPRKSSSYK